MDRLLIILISASLGLAPPPDLRILGGQKASPGQFPYIVSIRITNEPICGGSIINTKWVITGAYCVHFSTINLMVLAGTIYQNSANTIHRVNRAVLHEGFNISTFQNDIGLIQIEGEFEYSDFVQPIAFGDPDDGSDCTVAGWGGTLTSLDYSNDLQFVEMPLISLEDCAHVIEDFGNFYTGPEVVCTSRSDYVGAYLGDHGGPLVCGSKLAGVVSYSAIMANTTHINVCLRPTYYLNWINETTNS